MSELVTPPNPTATNPPVGVDLLGQSDGNHQEFDPQDYRLRTEATKVSLKKYQDNRGGGRCEATTTSP